MIPFAGVAMGLSFGFAGQLFRLGVWGDRLRRRMQVLALVRDDKDRPLTVTVAQADEAVMLEPTANERWGLRIAHGPLSADGAGRWVASKKSALTDLRGVHAMRAAARLLPHLNRQGANRTQLERAVELATANEEADAIFDQTARYPRPAWRAYGIGTVVHLIPIELRLALEMASHEEAERRAFEGELKQLEGAWREAEEIAGISDDMFLPEQVTVELARMKDRAR